MKVCEVLPSQTKNPRYDPRETFRARKVISKAMKHFRCTELFMSTGFPFKQSLHLRQRFESKNRFGFSATDF